MATITNVPANQQQAVFRFQAQFFFSFLYQIGLELSLHLSEGIV